MSDKSDHPVDTFRFTDADWAALAKLRDEHVRRGKKAVETAMKEIQREDLVTYVRIIGAYFPDQLREVLRDAMFDRGLTAEDLRELIHKSNVGGSSLNVSSKLRPPVRRVF